MIIDTQTITINGALGASTDISYDFVPRNYKITGIQFIEAANASGNDYDVRFSDSNTGVVIDFTPRLALLSVANGSTFRNVTFDQAFHKIELAPTTKVTVNVKHNTALAGGQSVTLKVLYRLEKNAS